MKIQLYYFALLQDQRGLAEEQLQIEPQTVSQLYSALKTQHHFSLKPEALRISVNERFVSWDTPLEDGDEVVFIPPVSGG